MSKQKRAALTLVVGFAAMPILAIVQPQRSVDSVQFRSELLVLHSDVRAARDIATLAGDERLIELGVSPSNAFVDLRTGRFAGLRMGEPLLPGRGKGNNLTWESFGASVPTSAKQLEAAAASAFRGYLELHASALGLDLGELAGTGKVSALSDDFVQIYIPRVVGGVEVRDSHVIATIKYGNLILLGLQNWADLDQSVDPRLSAEQADEALRRHVGHDFFGAGWKNNELRWLPVVGDDPIGGRLTYRLAWLVRNDLGIPGGRFEAYVDAASGEVLEIQDTIHRVATARTSRGGVLPVSNDGVGADGTEQVGWPLPFATVQTPFGEVTTDIGGNLPLCVDGNISGALSGPFVHMTDTCGASNLTSSSNLDWLSGPAPLSTDCTTPGVGGAGNTKSSRSGFHELNMLIAMAKSHLPANTWLDQQLNANMNIVDTCNATWDGTSVNFFRSGGGCRNTGEIAAIFDHEWGHGVDDNDNVPSIGSPGEAIADTYAALRLNTSCIGRGFFVGGLCGGYGDPCDPGGCSGVRDIDFMGHVSNLPAQIAGSPAINSCPAVGSVGPCGREVHCEGMAPAEAVWDLWNRELTSAPYNFSLDKSREIATQLTFRGGSNLTSWYTCDVAGPEYTGGCGAGMGYSSYLAADDDDGNLGNGTPHWVAIDDAFNSHKVGCSTDNPVDFGCAGTPAGTTTVTATSRDRGVDLSWTAVGGATGYRVYRTDGVFGCDFGKILVASVGAGTTTFNDRGLQNGREYSYIVIPMGAADECFGTESSCTASTPTSAGGGESAVAAVPSAVSASVYGGDSDFFIDNCEVLKLTVPIGNSGSTSLTNLQITAAVSTSHPASDLLTALPKTISASMPICGLDGAVVEFRVEGIAAGDTFEADITIDADELAGPEVVHVVSSGQAEGDFQNQAALTWNFTAGTQDWTVESGTFNRVNTGVGNPSPDPFWIQSSANLADQCDVVRSPAIRLSATSTLSMQTHYNIEPLSSQWYDRANLVFRDAGTSATTLLTPSSGRGYQASGVGGTCGTANQAGWAGTANQSWAASNWSSGALQTGTLANKPGHLVIRYGTDPGDHRDGFRFDVVSMTNFDLQVADTQSNTCSATSYLFADDFETGGPNQWSDVEP